MANHIMLTNVQNHPRYSLLVPQAKNASNYHTLYILTSDSTVDMRHCSQDYE